LKPYAFAEKMTESITNRKSKEDKHKEFSNEVVAVCVRNAVLQTEGVHSLATNTAEKYTRQVLRRNDNTIGIRIGRNKSGSLDIDVHLVALFNSIIPEVAWNVQSNVKEKIESMTGYSVENVNIHVEGVAAD